MLNLHVWGAAFGLPSIDAECLATIAHLYHAAPPSTWCLTPSSDPSVSPSHHLPALYHDGVWTSGYRQIVDYLTSNSLCRNLDESLDARQQADSVAYSAYLSVHAAPLVDLSLYVSAANWSAATRPAYSALLPFPLTWTVPPLIRAEAIKRAEHLGLAELDTDFDPSAGLHLSAGRDALPETFRRHLPVTTKKTVREEMTPEQAAAIRLHGLVGDCLSDVGAFMVDHEKQGDREPPRFFPGTPVSSLDCLAYGYLALMLKPSVPRSFLRDWMQAEAPRLSKFVDSVAPRDLPWSASDPPTVIGSSARVVDSILRNAPSLGEHYAKEMRLRAEQASHGLDRRALVLASSLVATGAVVGYGLYAYKSLQPFGARSQVWRAIRQGGMLSQFGELGTMLSGAMGTYQSAPMPSAPATGSLSTGHGRLVEMDSEVD
ncbi:outer mitochondrial membrane transport complex protein [Hirsutella rhossiliensis]|uniref:Outer mitochondrial membrane transport complex protein n=1 Tax=Hirsutella rhossiliensis TaxID=111463 RepID=A0A9P8SGT3_9HYPO|nr:outer mitochondrial membrane transport complex protein [Hirsutella rhossiliensis]KAH0962403.1 outer mitochondrial membrane transport complex protein [Hirsutella rhossiliensis]